MAKTIGEINEKIRKGSAVVMDAEEFTRLSQTRSPEDLAKEVDVVTTATFGAMCSSGAFINFGHWNPGIRMEEIEINGVDCYEGLAAVDSYIGATAESRFDNSYGGANVIEDLISEKDVHLHARGKGTDCYPTKEIDTWINKNTVNEFYLYNPRNGYQNYAAATNGGNSIMYTYMGSLMPSYGNVTYSTSGELSPLINDPKFRTIGIGTRIFLCGTTGYVVWNGTQFNTMQEKNSHDIPIGGGATIAVVGNAKEMSTDYLRAAYYYKYGVSMFIGLGVPIPVLDADMAKCLSISNKDIDTVVCDYSKAGHPSIQRTTYAELRSGSISIEGKKVRTAPMASLARAREIAKVLGSWIREGKFFLTEPVASFPEKSFVKPLVPRQEGN